MSMLNTSGISSSNPFIYDRLQRSCQTPFNNRCASSDQPESELSLSRTLFSSIPSSSEPPQRSRLGTFFSLINRDEQHLLMTLGSARTLSRSFLNLARSIERVVRESDADQGTLYANQAILALYDQSGRCAVTRCS